MIDKSKIPTGKTEKDNQIRKNLIIESLKNLSGTCVACPCLGNVLVEINSRSIKETANHARLSYESTIVAMALPEMIKRAKFYRMYIPKENRNQSKVFKFIFLYELRVKVGRNRYAKLMVGVRERGNFLHYCITCK